MPKLHKPPTFFFLNRPISSPVCVDENQRVAAERLIISRKPLRVFLFLTVQRSRQTHPSPSSCITVPQLPRVSSVQYRTKANLRHVTS